MHSRSSLFLEAMAQFRPYCPKKESCSKRGHNLGWFDSLEKAQAALKKHLTASDNHQMAEEEADTLVAEDAHYEKWSPGTSSNSRDSQSQSSAKRPRLEDSRPPEPSSSSRQHRRREPEPPQVIPALGMTAEDAAVTLEYVSTIMTRLTEKVGMIIAAARTAATFARQAESAFSQEANNLQLLLDQIQHIYSGQSVVQPVIQLG